MVCRTVKIGDTAAIVCGRGAPKRWCHVCRQRRGTLQCDFPNPKRKSGTCDKYLCARCAVQIGPNQDYCPNHEGPAQKELL